MRVYLAFARQVFINGLAYRGEVFLRIFLGLLFMTASLSIWRALYQTPAAIGETVSFEQMSMYVIGTTLLVNMLGLDEYYVAERIRNGDIALDLIKPFNFIGHLFARSVGRIQSQLLLVGLPTFVIASLIFRVPLPEGHDLLWFLPCALMALVLNFAVSVPIWLVNFWTLEADSMFQFKRQLQALIGGAFIPLWFFPEWLSKIASYLPFQGMYYLPLSIYTGVLPEAQRPVVLLIQAGWTVLFGIIGWGMWRAAFRHLVIQRG